MSALANKRVVITRAAHQAGELENRLRDRGATPLLYPCIAIQPPQDTSFLKSALQAALDGEFDWLVLTSTNTIQALRHSLDTMGFKLSGVPKLQIAAVGSATAQYAEEQLGLHVSVIPEQFSAKALAQALPFRENARIFLPQSEIAEPTLANTLSEMGASVTAVTAYQTVIGGSGVDLPELLKSGDVDAIIFTSASTVNYLLQRLKNENGDPNLLSQLCIACIGTSTAAAARQNNLTVHVMPEQPTLDGLIDALERHYAELTIGESE